jgi:hypothetical protein
LALWYVKVTHFLLWLLVLSSWVLFCFFDFSFLLRDRGNLLLFAMVRIFFILLDILCIYIYIENDARNHELKTRFVDLKDIKYLIFIFVSQSRSFFQKAFALQLNNVIQLPLPCTLTFIISFDPLLFANPDIFWKIGHTIS